MRATTIIMAFVHGFVRSLLVVLCGGLCCAAASLPLVQIEESYPDSPLVTRVQEAESRREKHPQGKQFGGERKLAVDQIALDVLAPISEVDPEFLSVTIDAGDISRNWSGITFTAQRIINMARGLAPAMLRVGGTSGDFILFNSSTGISIAISTHFCISSSQMHRAQLFGQANSCNNYTFSL